MDKINRLFRRKTAIIGLMIALIIVILALLAPIIAPYGPVEQNRANIYKPPFLFEGGTTEHLFGTDNLGRDIFSRTIYGSRTSLLVGISGIVISVMIGSILGAISGYYGGYIDNILMRIAEVQLSFPFILLAIGVIAVIGPDTTNIILIFGIGYWPIFGRTVRSIFLYTKETEFVEGARARGASDLRIIVRHIFPGVIPSLIVISTLSLGTFIIMEATLSFLGLGVPPPHPTWGRMMSEGRQYMHYAWWLITIPGAFLSLFVLSINLFGDGLRDALDPKIK